MPTLTTADEKLTQVRTRQFGRWSLLTIVLLALAGPARADDWPQWLGPNRDAIWRETGIVEAFPEGGPPVRWRTPIGAGYSGPAVAGGRVYITDRKLAPQASNPADPFQRGLIQGTERVLCLDAEQGRVLWQHEYDCPYDVSYPAGPRTTPLVDGSRVYTLGTEGHLLCLETNTGAVVWSHEFKKAYQVSTPAWGFAAHPLLEGNKLICLARGTGTTVVAFDKLTGRELWRALSASEPGYCPPMIYELAGRRQLIVWHPEAVNGLDPETGRVYWSFPFPVRAGLTVSTPRQQGDRLFVTSFYNSSRMLRVAGDPPSVTLDWQGQSRSERNTDTLHSIIATPFWDGDHIYGVCSYGQLRCLNAQNGARIWETLRATTNGKETRWGNAFLVKNGSRFFLANEQGDLIIARLTPAGYEEISRARLLDPTNTAAGRDVVWSHPAFANRNVYARNDKELVCVSLASDNRNVGR